MTKKILICLLTALLNISFSNSFAQAPRKPDPSGVNTGTSVDLDTSAYKVDDTLAKTKDTTVAALNTSVKKLAGSVSNVANAAGKNKVAINLVWLLIAGFLVFFMQAGFALVETGLTRAKNVGHTMAMNLFVYLQVALDFLYADLPLCLAVSGL